MENNFLDVFCGDINGDLLDFRNAKLHSTQSGEGWAVFLPALMHYSCEGLRFDCRS